MKQVLLFTAILCLANAIYGQAPFQYRYGSSYYDHANRTIQTQDGTFITVGHTYGFGSSINAFIMKVNSEGLLLWVKDYSGINADFINDVIELPNRELIMCGQTGSYGAGGSDAFIMKTDSIGNLLWANAYGDIFGEGFNQLVEDGANGFYVSGWTDIPSGLKRGTTISRVDNFGGVIWSKWVDDDLITREALMTPISTGGVIIGNRVNSNGAFSLWKFSNSGALVWSNMYTPTPVGSGLFGLDLIESTSGNILVATSLSNVNTFAQSVDIVIIRLDNLGNLISDISYGSTYIDNIKTIDNTADGGTILCGYTNSAGNGGKDVFLIKLSPTGGVEWSKAYGTVWDEEPMSIYQTIDGGYIFNGFTYSTGSSFDSTKVYLVKTDSIGNVNCNSVSWTPNTENHTLNVSAATSPSNFTFLQRNTINWNLNSRNFYNSDICSKVSILTEELKSGYLKCFPNPASNLVYLEISDDVDTRRVAIYSITGNKVFDDELGQDKVNSIDISSFSSGYYIVRLHTSVGVQSSRFCVVR